MSYKIHLFCDIFSRIIPVHKILQLSCEFFTTSGGNVTWIWYHAKTLHNYESEFVYLRITLKIRTILICTGFTSITKRFHMCVRWLFYKGSHIARLILFVSFVVAKPEKWSATQLYTTVYAENFVCTVSNSQLLTSCIIFKDR